MPKPIVSTSLEPDRYEQMQEALKTVSSLGSQIHQYNRDIEGLKDRSTAGSLPNSPRKLLHRHRQGDSKCLAAQHKSVSQSARTSHAGTR